ncbi:MAG: hypothetical protein DI562_03325 [Stenotrophomonas acidaminiphila]|nr:MAG: hypothetical protein DI562_03325 [Stenotrophomonas acidaminiphila]
MLRIGPILSFRGSVAQQWRVTVLIGIAQDLSPPALTLEGRACAAPMRLYQDAQNAYWRYDLTTQLQSQERTLTYAITGEEATWSFTIPALEQAPRMAYVSCNGFSDPNGMRKLVRPQNAVWTDLLCNHQAALRPAGYVLDREQLWHERKVHDKGLQRFHVLTMGGDQIYFDSIWEDLPPLKRWVGLSRKKQLEFKVTPSLRQSIESYYMELYSQRWLPRARSAWNKDRRQVRDKDKQTDLYDAADAMARIPTVMMWDDHDIFDGWGSYTPEMQHCELFQILFQSARRAFWVFQMQHAIEHLPPLTPTARPNVSQQDPQFAPLALTDHVAQDALALPILPRQPGFTQCYLVGPLALVVADLRTERSRTQILSDATWSSLQHWMETLPSERDGKDGCAHVVVLSSVPVAHPKLSLAEVLLDSLGHDHVLDSNADDLRDHWSHDDHEGERKRLIETLSRLAEKKRLRTCIVSGDVHVAARGGIYRQDTPPAANWAQIHQFTSSAIVHPSLVGVMERLFLQLLNRTAAKAQAIDVQHTVEMMLFPGHHRYVMAARNWLALEVDADAHQDQRSQLWATWRCENEKGFSNHLQAVPAAVLD